MAPGPSNRLLAGSRGRPRSRCAVRMGTGWSAAVPSRRCAGSDKIRTDARVGGLQFDEPAGQARRLRTSAVSSRTLPTRHRRAADSRCSGRAPQTSGPNRSADRPGPSGCPVFLRITKLDEPKTGGRTDQQSMTSPRCVTYDDCGTAGTHGSQTGRPSQGDAACPNSGASRV